MTSTSPEFIVAPKGVVPGKGLGSVENLITPHASSHLIAGLWNPVLVLIVHDCIELNNQNFAHAHELMRCVDWDEALLEATAKTFQAEDKMLPDILQTILPLSLHMQLHRHFSEVFCVSLVAWEEVDVNIQRTAKVFDAVLQRCTQICVGNLSKSIIRKHDVHVVLCVLAPFILLKQMLRVNNQFPMWAIFEKLLSRIVLAMEEAISVSTALSHGERQSELPSNGFAAQTLHDHSHWCSREAFELYAHLVAVDSLMPPQDEFH
mmetsp:Transcript_41665/g.74835  ORF Transcript_41665/g.74835 Transcript_41665/m.74835 type:complete len:263 (+) Transcript_41665:1585-2373(+)